MKTVCIGLFLCCLGWPSVLAQAPGAGTTGKESQNLSSQPTRVLARVGDSLITVADVDLELGRTASSRSDLPPVPEPVLMAAVDLIAQRRQALASLNQIRKRVPDSVIDKWLLDNSPAELKLSAAQALAARAEAAHVSPENYREFLAFRLSWPAYLQSVMTEQNLEKHFKKQPARFDGTRFEVEHIWLPVAPGPSKERQAAHEKLLAVRQQMLAGQLTTDQALEQLLGPENAAAARPATGPLWLTGNGPLMPIVIDHVLKTPANQFTEPFDSTTAVHLLRVIKIEPGKRSFAEAQDDCRKHTLVYLLNFLAQKSAQDLPLVWQAPAASQ